MAELPIQQRMRIHFKTTFNLTYITISKIIFCLVQKFNCSVNQFAFFLCTLQFYFQVFHLVI